MADRQGQLMRRFFGLIGDTFVSGWVVADHSGWTGLPDLRIIAIPPVSTH